MTPPSYEQAIQQTGILGLLAPFDPHVVGTLPLGIALPDSDIDIICHAPDRDAIAEVIWTAFRNADGFSIYQWSARGRPLIAKFEAAGWPLRSSRLRSLWSIKPRGSISGSNSGFWASAASLFGIRS